MRRASGFLSILSALMVINSNGRFLYIRSMITRSGISVIHGPHHDAQIFISLTLPVLFLISSLTPSASISSSVTGNPAQSLYSFFVYSFFHDHLTEHPNTFVKGVVTG